MIDHSVALPLDRVDGGDFDGAFTSAPVRCDAWYTMPLDGGAAPLTQPAATPDRRAACLPRLVQRVALGAQRDGRLVAMRHDVLSLISRLDEAGDPAAPPMLAPYACPNVRTSHRLLRLDALTPASPHVSPEAGASYAIESAMDELSYALGLDPLAPRLRSYAKNDVAWADRRRAGSRTRRTLPACCVRGAERFGWSRRRRAPRSMRDGKLLVGWGMATAALEGHGADWSSGAIFAEVHVDEDRRSARVTRVVGAFATGELLETETLARGPDLGMGAIGVVGMGAAVANAVFHATGRRARDLPITDAVL
jgi:CO/xanthine dehydrogenase Mo-binding subunit